MTGRSKDHTEDWMNGPALDLRTVGRAAKPVLAEVLRPLTEEDLKGLDVEKGVKPSHIQRLRDHHHLIARMMAEGKRTNEIALATGISVSRVSVYRSDPSFQQLLAHYKDKVEETRDDAYAGVAEKLAAVSHDALEEMHDRLLDDPEKINNDQLLDLIKATADRTGFGPQTKSTNLNVNVDLAGRVQAGRLRVARLAQGQVLAGPPAPVVEGEVQAVLPSTTEPPK